METCVRVIECGGQGPRRVDVYGKEKPILARQKLR